MDLNGIVECVDETAEFLQVSLADMQQEIQQLVARGRDSTLHTYSRRVDEFVMFKKHATRLQEGTSVDGTVWNRDTTTINRGKETGTWLTFLQQPDFPLEYGMQGPWQHSKHTPYPSGMFSERERKT